MRDHEKAFLKKGARLAAVGLGDMRHAKEFRVEAGIGFPLLVDGQLQAYRAAELHTASLLHLLQRENARERARARAAGHRQHRLGKNPFQLGGSFVFGPGNVDLYVHISETFGDNAGMDELVAAIPAGSTGRS